MMDSRKHSQHSTLSPAAEAYVWGYPLVAIHRTRLLLCSKTPSATVNHINELATPRDRAIVVPNNDTLYSSGWYDLRHGDLTIEVPAMDHPNRYWNLMIMDAFGHVAYVRRAHHGTNGTNVKVTLDPKVRPENSDNRVVTVGTPTAWVIMRVLVEHPEDIATARALQHAFRIEPPKTHPIELTERAGRATAIAKSGADFYLELKQYLQTDPPADWHPQLSAPAQQIIDNPDSIARDELLAGVNQGEETITGRKFLEPAVANGWSTGRDKTGFGGNILKRAAAAKFGLGGHQAIENRSYTALADTNNDQPNGTRLLTLRFGPSELPPCDAFWSLTAYGPDMYLIDNVIDRWSISDRTPGLSYGKDGSLTIYVCAEPPKQAAQRANWLPVPEGPYLLGMRVYEGSEKVVNCEWFPPPLEVFEKTRSSRP